MLNSLKLFFKEKMELKEVTPSSSLQRAMQVATCAVLLEAAMADNELSGEELDHIYTALQHLYHMDRSDIDQLLEMTRLFVGRARGTYISTGGPVFVETLSYPPTVVIRKKNRARS